MLISNYLLSNKLNNKNNSYHLLSISIMLLVSLKPFEVCCLMILIFNEETMILKG